MSPLARAWLAGCLFGNEPDPWDVPGKDPDDEIIDEEYDVWWEKLAEFRRTGGMVLPIRED
jgi:hypothetical protein